MQYRWIRYEWPWLIGVSWRDAAVSCAFQPAYDETGEVEQWEESTAFGPWHCIGWRTDHNILAEISFCWHVHLGINDDQESCYGLYEAQWGGRGLSYCGRESRCCVFVCVWFIIWMFWCVVFYSCCQFNEWVLRRFRACDSYFVELVLLRSDHCESNRARVPSSRPTLLFGLRFVVSSNRRERIFEDFVLNSLRNGHQGQHSKLEVTICFHLDAHRLWIVGTSLV